MLSIITNKTKIWINRPITVDDENTEEGRPLYIFDFVCLKTNDLHWLNST